MEYENSSASERLEDAIEEQPATDDGKRYASRDPRRSP
jgi:hypothetical protein